MTNVERLLCAFPGFLLATAVSAVTMVFYVLFNVDPMWWFIQSVLAGVAGGAFAYWKAEAIERWMRQSK
jgi:hypothetical protein